MCKITFYFQDAIYMNSRKTILWKKNFIVHVTVPKWLHCNQTHQLHHPQKSQYLPNSSPQSESQLIRTMMINEVGLTTTGSELHFDSIISIFQDTYAQYIENIRWHGDTWICIYFKGVRSHISGAGACACSSQDTHLFFICIYVWKWAHQHHCLVHRKLISGCQREWKLTQDPNIPKLSKLSGYLKTKEISWPEKETSHFQFKHVLNCTDMLVQGVDPMSQLMKDDLARWNDHTVMQK